MNIIEILKKGSGIHIKPENKGKFTKYCHGKVTSECIARGKKSSDPAVRKRATFAANARKWSHKNGGSLEKLTKQKNKGGFNFYDNNVMDTNPDTKYVKKRWKVRSAQQGAKMDWSPLIQAGVSAISSGIETAAQNKALKKQQEANNQLSKAQRQKTWAEKYYEALQMQNDPSLIVRQKNAYNAASAGNIDNETKLLNAELEAQKSQNTTNAIVNGIGNFAQVGLGLLSNRQTSSPTPVAKATADVSNLKWGQQLSWNQWKQQNGYTF